MPYSGARIVYGGSNPLWNLTHANTESLVFVSRGPRQPRPRQHEELPSGLRTRLGPSDEDKHARYSE